MSEELQRRYYKRVKDNLQVKLEYKSEGEDISKIKVGTSMDISATGILVTYERPIEIDSIINVSFVKPKTFEMFNSSVKVMRVEKNKDGTYEIGLQFLDMSDKDKNILDYILTWETES